MINKEIIICAAVRASDGIIVRGHRHCDAIRTLQNMKHYLLERPNGDNQGFVTSKNRYVNRKEGLKIQLEAGIKSADKHRNFEYMSDELYSEDLY